MSVSDIHKCSLKGKRSQNEDKHDCILNLDKSGPEYDDNKGNINYYAVYDGHGGKGVSNYLSEHLPSVFTDKRVVYPIQKKFVTKLCNYWQDELKTKYTKVAERSGSTCCICIQYKEGSSEYLNVINTGDSRCIMCRNNMAIPLSKDHKPSNFEEHARITNMGGEIYHDGYDYRIGSLSVSRAFGDTTEEPYVTCLPDIFRYKINNDDKFIVLACDGLYDVMNNDEVVNFVLMNCYDIKTERRINKHVNIAKKLAEKAILTGSTDNVSIIIIFLDSKK
jgi:serine/threonine protein phosphatase PrpC